MTDDVDDRMGLWLNVGCGTHRAPAPWWNIDHVRIEDGNPADRILPDQVTVPGEPLPFADGSCDRVLLSHVLEHVPWEQVPDFLLDVRRVAAAEVLIVGPDLWRTLQAWKDGAEPWSLVSSVAEHRPWPADMAHWPGAPHHWNCHEARVVDCLTRTGWHAQPVLDDADLQSWPVVAWNRRWQFAIVARSTRLL